MEENIMTPGTELPFGLFLNAEMIYEIVREIHPETELLRNKARQSLTGVQFYCGQNELDQNNAYICSNEILKKSPITVQSCVLIIVGEFSESTIPYKSCSCIAVKKGGVSVFEISNILMQALARYSVLEKKLIEVINNYGGLLDICSIASEHFQETVFVHDEYFNILASTTFEGEGVKFTFNERTQSYMQSVDTLNSFKISAAYKHTLMTRGGQLWDSDYNKEAALYANIWINNSYKGRLVIPSAVERVKPIQLAEVTYFSEVIKLVMTKNHLDGAEDVNPLKSFIIDAVDGIDIDKVLLKNRAESNDWGDDDKYVCGVISFANEEVTHLAVFAICNDIERSVPGSWACYYKNAIYLIVNLTKGNIGPNQLRMQMSYTIRESMLNMGVSNIFQNIVDFPTYIEQAKIALEYAQKKAVPLWYNEFKNCVIEYWTTEGQSRLDKRVLISSALPMLKDYDAKNGTNLHQTLKTFLYYERNSTLTAKILKVHRSTLPHRLERIAQLTELNLDDYRTRLYLNLSFALEEDE